MSQTAVAAPPTLGIEGSDVTGQKGFRAPAVPADFSIGQMLRTLLEKMGLARTDAEGRPVSFRARLEREGRFLHPSDRVGDVIQPDDRLVLAPNVNAGAL